MRKLLIYIIALLILPLMSVLVVSCRVHGPASSRAPKQPSTAERVLDTVVNTLSKDLDYLAGDVLTSDSLGQQLAVVDSIHSDALLPDSLHTAPTDSAPLLNDSLPLPKAALNADSVLRASSSARNERLASSRVIKDKVDLDAAVHFTSSDSMIIIRRDSAFMYGQSTVDYDKIKLNAQVIEMNLNDNTVYAHGVADSLGEVKGRPVFNDGGSDYEANTMRYNFKTQKGFITDVVTQQGEGYLTGGQTKKNADGSYDVSSGKYTTCDDHECPHFYFQLTKAKMRPGKNIVMGPAYMVLAGLPLPLAVPFGFFPFTDDYASGVIVPTFGDDYQRGFYLSDGGYYLAISDNMDLALTGELYTKGSWGLRAQSNYTKRYKYSGNFNISYLKTITGEKGSPDYAAQTNFQVLWSHSQDSKANPNMSLSASVNFTTSGYLRNEVNSYYTNAFTENTKSSTVNMTYRVPNSKWSMSTTMNISQRTQDSTLAVSFPNLTITMGQTQPFKRKKAVGDERWYEKIKLSYSGQFQNSLTAKQDQFFKKSLIKDWRNGMRHSVPVSATFNMLNYINVTPSLNFTDRMYTSKVRQHWDPDLNRAVSDTTYNFYNVWDFAASLSFDTKFYGIFRPWAIFGDKVKMIRHVLTPTVSFSATPDFSSPFFGYYDTYDRPMSDGSVQQVKYSMFQGQLFGVPGQGRTGAISLSLSNNVEMKVKSDADSTGTKKISLIENLTLSQSYNMAADSMRFSDLNTSMLLRLTKGFNLNLNATWDVYCYQLSPQGSPVRVNKLRILNGKGFGRLRATGTSFSYTFNNDTFKKLFNKGSSKSSSSDSGDTDESQNAASTHNSREKQKGSDEFSADGYMAWDVPWSLTFNYSVNYGYGAFNKKKMEYDSRITQNLSFSGTLRPTKNWNFSFSASYNFDTKKLAYMNCNMSRDLHCFTMTASFVPVGPYKSYNFHIAVKSSLLSDFKYDKRSSMSNGVRW